MRKAALVWAVLLLALTISACGGKTQAVDVDQLAGELLEQVAFEDELTELDDSMVAALYGVENAQEQKVYLSGGATAEEVAVFRFATEEEAQAALAVLEQRLESRSSALVRRSAAPDPEQKELDDPVNLEYIDWKDYKNKLTDDQRDILLALERGPQVADDLVERTQIPARRVLAALTILQVQGFVAEESGKRFRALVRLKIE